MSRRVSAREARSRFAEITDRVRYTGEPVIVEKQGRPFVALVSLDDLGALERLRAHERDAEFVRASKEASAKKRRAGIVGAAAEPSEEDIVRAVRGTRESLYRERYGRS